MRSLNNSLKIVMVTMIVARQVKREIAAIVCDFPDPGILNYWPQLFEGWITLSTRINFYLVDGGIGFPNTYPLDSTLGAIGFFFFPNSCWFVAKLCCSHGLFYPRYFENGPLEIGSLDSDISGE